jgi:hypothetical protein
MAIDTRYLMSPSLQQYFVDKDTGFPLAAGEVYFFEDNNRTQPKSVYKLSGSPPNYSFVAIGNKITLSSVGTMADDLGNDFIPYVLPEDDDGNLQLYYIEIYSAGGPTDGILQFTREAWPPEASTESGNQGQDSSLNLIPNGQFALHNNIAANLVNGNPAGRITGSVTEVAPGGWTFERPNTSLATDTVTFTRLNAFTDNPSASPRYEILVQSNGGSPSDTFKDLRKKFNDVNKFASDIQQYTVFFSARSTTGNSFTVSLNLIKNYGTSGDPQEIINIDDFTITPTQQNFSTSFVWGTNSGKLIGPLNDDFCQLAFSMPISISFGAAMTDFTNLIGEINITQFPITTDEDFVDRSLVPPIPGFNAETFGLPIISTARGLDYDYSYVGMVTATSRLTAPAGWVLANGQTIRTDDFYPDGVPCSRLRNTVIDNTIYDNQEIPFFGTGSSYVTAYRTSAGAGSAVIISANSAGISAPISDVSTGFQFLRVSTGVLNRAVYALDSYQCQQPNSFWIESVYNGVTNSSSSSAGAFFNMSGNLQSSTVSAFCNVNHGERYGTDTVRQLLLATVTGVPIAGHYVNIKMPASVNDLVFWFNVDGVGVQPAVPGLNTYVRINLTSQFSIYDVAHACSSAFGGAEIGYFVPLAGGSILPNSYFNFFVGTQAYYVWYSLNNLGTDPNVPGAIGIKVTYNLLNTVPDIAILTSRAINRMYYSIPDLRGWIIRGIEQSQFIDSRSNLRYFKDGNRSNVGNATRSPGTYQFESQLGNVISNRGTTPPGVPPSIYPTYPLPGSRTSPPGSTDGFNYAGTSALDTKNAYFNYLIKY